MIPYRKVSLHATEVCVVDPVVTLVVVSGPLLMMMLVVVVVVVVVLLHHCLLHQTLARALVLLTLWWWWYCIGRTPRGLRMDRSTLGDPAGIRSLNMDWSTL